MAQRQSCTAIPLLRRLYSNQPVRRLCQGAASPTSFSSGAGRHDVKPPSIDPARARDLLDPSRAAPGSLAGLFYRHGREPISSDPSDFAACSGVLVRAGNLGVRYKDCATPLFRWQGNDVGGTYQCSLPVTIELSGGKLSGSSAPVSDSLHRVFLQRRVQLEQELQQKPQDERVLFWSAKNLQSGMKESDHGVSAALPGDWIAASLRKRLEKPTSSDCSIDSLCASQPAKRRSNDSGDQFWNLIRTTLLDGGALDKGTVVSGGGGRTNVVATMGSHGTIEMQRSVRGASLGQPGSVAQYSAALTSKWLGVYCPEGMEGCGWELSSVKRKRKKKMNKHKQRKLRRRNK